MTKEEAIYVLKNTAWLGSAELAGDVTEAVKMAVNVLKRSEAPNSSDTISRQAAIDFINAGHLVNPNEPRWSDNEVVNFLKSRPSAQPEIIYCKDCKHRPKATRADEKVFYGFSVKFPDEKCPCYCEDGWYGWYPEDDFYCGYAERREG